MKLLILSSLLLASTASFANDSVNLCVGNALKAARTSLVKTDRLDGEKLFDVEMKLFVNDDAQYLKTRSELEKLCRRFQIKALEN